MHVLEAVLADQVDELRACVHTFAMWFFATRECNETLQQTVYSLEQASDQLQEKWRSVFHDTGVHTVNKIPKFHRVAHVPESVALYGPYLYLTTEASESSHKSLKKMFRMCVCNPFSSAQLHAYYLLVIYAVVCACILLRMLLCYMP